MILIRTSSMESVMGILDEPAMVLSSLASASGSSVSNS
jgi:hypothetical protein